MSYTIEQQINLLKQKSEGALKLIENVNNQKALIDLEIEFMYDEHNLLKPYQKAAASLHCIKLDIRQIKKEIDWLNTHQTLNLNQKARKLHLLKKYSKALNLQRKRYDTITKYNKKRIDNLENSNSIEQLEKKLFGEFEMA